MNENIIPIHNFSLDNEETDEYFRLIELKTTTGYDTSIAHRHNYYEIFIFEKGGGSHDLDFQTVAIEDRSVHFVSPGQVHKVRREKSSCGYIILFSRDFFYLNNQNSKSLYSLHFLNNHYINPIISLNKIDFKQIMILVDGMNRERINGVDYHHSVIQSYLSILLLTCKRSFEERDGKEEIHGDIFQQFRHLLEAKFEEKHALNFMQINWE